MASHLSRAGWRVVLAERRRYPADKLCGEFLSPEGVESLGRMGLGAALAAFPRIEEVLVSSPSGQFWRGSLPAAGVGISRRRLDLLLLEHGAGAGVEVAQGVRINQVEGDLEKGFRAEGREVRVRARLVVGAWGKQQSQKGRRSGLMALKVHAQGQQRGVELHPFPGGYAGLCQVENNEVNLCLLTRVDAFRQAGSDCRRFSSEIMSQNPLLAERLDKLNPDWDQALAAANLSFGPASCQVGGTLLVGDAAGTIAPLCGDGMAMALAAGEMLALLADPFLRGALSGPALTAEYARGWQEEFCRRLQVGGLLQQALLHPGWTRVAVGILRRFPGLGQGLYRWTRGGQE